MISCEEGQRNLNPCWRSSQFLFLSLLLEIIWKKRESQETIKEKNSLWLLSHCAFKSSELHFVRELSSEKISKIHFFEETPNT